MDDKIMEKNGAESPLRDENGKFLPGHPSITPGRPKGSENPLKRFQRNVFDNMTDEEKKEFLSKIAPEMRWRMAEGNPKQETELSTDTELPFIIKIIKDDGTKGEGS